MQTRKSAPLHDATSTPENHRRWIARFDALWSGTGGDGADIRQEMQVLLALIERYEQQSRP